MLAENPTHNDVPRDARDLVRGARPSVDDAELPSERAYRALREAIITHSAPIGRLQITDLSDALKLSVTPVREALNRLRGEGFVEFTPRKGYYTHLPREQYLLDHYDVLDIFAKSVADKRADMLQTNFEVDLYRDLLADEAVDDRPGMTRLFELQLEFLALFGGNAELLRITQRLIDVTHFVRSGIYRHGLGVDRFERSTGAISSALLTRQWYRVGDGISAHLSFEKECCWAVVSRDLEKAMR